MRQRDKEKSIILTPQEIKQLTGRSHRLKQLEHLRNEGFLRASLSYGQVRLERVHYEAVCRGEYRPFEDTSNSDQKRPQVRKVRSKK